MDKFTTSEFFARFSFKLDDSEKPIIYSEHTGSSSRFTTILGPEHSWVQARCTTEVSLAPTPEMTDLICIASHFETSDPSQTNFPSNSVTPFDSSQTYSDECRICNSIVEEWVRVFNKHGVRSHSWGVCQKCGTAMHMSPPSHSWLKGFYSSTWDTSRRLNPRVDPVVTLERLSQNLISESCKVLDIGAGFGNNMNMFLKKGIDAYGVEPSVHRFNHAHDLVGDRLFCGTIEDAISNGFLADKGPFDMVYSHHVFEHLSSPLDVLIKIRPLIRDNGYLYLGVPSYLNETVLQTVMFVLHVFSWTPKSLKYLLAKAGFEVVREESGANHINVICRKVGLDAIDPERLSASASDIDRMEKRLFKSFGWRGTEWDTDSCAGVAWNPFNRRALLRFISKGSSVLDRPTETRAQTNLQRALPISLVWEDQEVAFLVK